MTAVETQLRPEIKRSWERSAQCGLDRASELCLPYEPDVRSEARFLSAATPVLDHVGTFLEGSHTTAVLTDGRGRLLDRRCADSALARVLDRTSSAPGFLWSEEHSGTTALSLAIEERIPAWIGPGEHYLEALRHLVCAAVPVIHPITQRLQGIIDVTSQVQDASRHMMPVVLQAARAIEERLYDSASATEQALLSHFMSASTRSGRPVVVLGERVELSTPPAARMLSVEDKTLLWERATFVIKDRPEAKDTLTLADGSDVTAHFVRVDVAGRRVGVVIEFEPAPGAPRASGTSGERSQVRAPVADRSLFRGRSLAAQRLREQMSALRDDTIPLLITGEAGVGKLALAKCAAPDSSEAVLLDAARTSVDGERALLRQLAAVAESPGKTLIVRHIGCLSPAALQALPALAATAEDNGSRIIATATTGQAAEMGHQGLTQSFGLHVEVPPLRERTDDLLDLVPHFIERRGATARMAPVAIQMLMRYEWPGNVRELDNLIRGILMRKRSADIVLSDLPAPYQRGRRRLRRIDQIERTAIVQALAEAHGNKTQAAELLEIGRATLYRKIRAYGLDAEDTIA